MFTIYEDKGVSGVNLPFIDFGWKGGVVSPDFRRYILDRPSCALLEKCIIYDGGARRYEIPLHFEEVLEYWEGLLGRAALIDPVELLGEKLGYPEPLGFDEWKEVTAFQALEYPDLEGLWRKETQLFTAARGWDLEEIARQKIASIKSIQTLYEE
jgi:hypothetical protein